MWENGNVTDLDHINLEESMFVRVARGNINSEVSRNNVNGKLMIRQIVGFVCGDKMMLKLRISMINGQRMEQWQHKFVFQL